MGLPRQASSFEYLTLRMPLGQQVPTELVGHGVELGMGAVMLEEVRVKETFGSRSLSENPCGFSQTSRI